MQATLITAPRTTTRAMLDPTRLCHLRCEFCYYRPTDAFHTVKPWEAQAKEVSDAKARGCDAADLTGGDPLTNPHVVELVKLCVEQGISLRIISSLICAERVLDDVLDAGVDDWLISMHGAKAETHNDIVKVPHAREKQIRRMAKIAARMRYCCNYVMVAKNQTEMAAFSHWLIGRDHEPPKIVNFICFNPFGDWLQSAEMRKAAYDQILDLRIAGPILYEAIDVLESAGIGVNVRYYPMCGLAERHRKNVCNDRQVAFDLGEWDNAFGARTPVDVVLRTYSIPLSYRNEEQGEPCCDCNLHGCCGGANRIWHALAKEKFGTSPLVPITLPEGPVGFWHYRGQNVMGLDPRAISQAPATLQPDGR